MHRKLKFFLWLGLVGCITGAGPVIWFGNNSKDLSVSGLMTNATDLIQSVAAPSAPAAGTFRIYSRTDNNLYYKINGGAETALTPAAAVPSTGGIVYSNGSALLSATGTSGGIPYFSAANVPATSAALASGFAVLGGGAGVAPATTSAISVTSGFVNHPTNISIAAYNNNSSGNYTSGTTNPVAYDTQLYEVGGDNYAPGSAATPTAGVFTVPSGGAGKYLISATISLNNGTGVISAVNFQMKKGAGVFANLFKGTVSTGLTDFCYGGSVVVSLSAGDTISFQVTVSTTGGAGNWFIGSDSASFLNIEKIQ